MALDSVSSYLTEQPESGAAKNADSSWSSKEFHRVWAFPRQYHDAVVASIEQNEIDIISGNGYLRSFNTVPDGPYCKLEAVYSNSPSSMDCSTHPTETPQYFLVWVQDDIPVERLTGYKAQWNNYLAADSTIDATVPAWQATNKNTILGKADSLHYRWCKDPAQIPEGWHIVAIAMLPGLDMKMNFRATIREIVWCGSYKAAKARACIKMMFARPKVDYGIGDDSHYWLEIPSQISPDGSLYRIETLYIHSEKEWDKNIYP